MPAPRPRHPVAAVSPSAAEMMNSAASPALPRSGPQIPGGVSPARGIDQIEFQKASYAVGASVRLMERCWRISTGS